MLTVSGGIFSRTISAQRIMRVTEAAHQNAVAASGSVPAHTADAQYMGPLDWLTDHVFCGGVKTAVLADFDEIGRKAAALKRELQKNDAEKNPQLIKQVQQQIQRAQRRLNQVISDKTVAIDYDGLTAQTDSGFIIIREKANRLPTGIALCRPAADNPPAPLLQAPGELFSCAAPESIQLADLAKIRSAGTFRCAGQLITVRFIKNNEPVVISSTSSIAQMQVQPIQKRLTSLWFANAVHEQLDRLDSAPAIDPTLQLHPLFQHQEAAMEVVSDTQLTSMEWSRFVQFIQTQFSASIEHMHASITKPYLTVVPELSRLSLIDNPGIEDRRKLKACRGRLNEQMLKLEKLNGNMTRLKVELNNLSHLVSFCTETQMVAIFRQRIINFQERVSDFSCSAMGPNEVSALNHLLETQHGFLSNFGPEKIAQCYRLIVPPDTPTTLRHGIVPPVGRVYQESLISLLIDPAKPLNEVLTMMENLAQKNERLCQIRISQKGLADKIEANMRLCVFSEGGKLYRAGLDPDFGMSFYTPKTYACIVSLLQMRKDLLDPGKHFSKRELLKMRRSILANLRQIIAEDAQIIRHEHGDFSLRSTGLHRPATSEDGTLVKHEYWARHVQSAAFRSKIALIKKNLAEARSANRAAIAQLQKRGETMDRLSEKSAFLSETALTYKEEMTKLRASFA